MDDFGVKRGPRNVAEKVWKTTTDFSAALYEAPNEVDKAVLVGEHVVMGLYEATIGLHEVRQTIIDFSNDYERIEKDSRRAEDERFRKLQFLLSQHLSFVRAESTNMQELTRYMITMLDKQERGGFWKRLGRKLVS